MNAHHLRLEILKKVESGEISIEEGSSLLGMLEKGVYDELPPRETISLPMREEEGDQRPALGFWKGVWSGVLWLGIIVAVLGAYWLYRGSMAGSLGWSFWLSWIPFLMGVGLIVCGAEIFVAPWLFVKIKQKPGAKPQKILIALPFPFHLAQGIFHVFGRFMPPAVREKHLDDFLSIFEELNEPIHLWVNDEDGEQVEVYIGR